MTTMINISLTCPCCGATFASRSLMSTNTMGRKTDFHPITAGYSPLPLYIHTCPHCGCSGFQSDFDADVTLPDEAKRLIHERLTPLVRDEEAFPGRRYEYTAWIAEWRGDLPHAVAHLYLMAAWCCDDDGRADEEAYYRRQAIDRFALALAQGCAPEEEIPALTYLIGELYRRVGDSENAQRWFDRVAAAAAGRKGAAWLVERAHRQKTAPEETM